MVPKITYANRN